MKYFRSHDRLHELLFDLSSDPEEKRNAANDAQWASVKAELAHEMDRVFEMGKPCNLARFTIE